MKRSLWVLIPFVLLTSCNAKTPDTPAPSTAGQATVLSNENVPKNETPTQKNQEEWLALGSKILGSKAPEYLKLDIGKYIGNYFALMPNGTIGYSSNESNENIVVLPNEVIDAQYTTSDLNNDGNLDYLITLENNYYGGDAGKSLFVFVIGENKAFNVLDVPVSAYKILETKTNEFKNIELQGIGSCKALWTWDGEKYNWKESTNKRGGQCD